MSANEEHRRRADGFQAGLEEWASRSPSERQDIRAFVRNRSPKGAPQHPPAALALIHGELPNGAILLAIRNSAFSGRPLLVTTERELDDRTFYLGIAALSWDQSRVQNSAEQRVIRVMPDGRMISENDGVIETAGTGDPDANNNRHVVGLLTQSALTVSMTELPILGRARLFEF